MENNFIILLVFLLGAMFTFFLTRNFYKKNNNQISKENLEKLKEELISQKTKLSEKEEQLFLLNKSNEEFKNFTDELKEKNTILETQKIETDKTINNRKKDIEEIKKLLPNEFKNLANNIFTEKTNLFKKESKNTLNDIVTPLNHELEKLKKHVSDKFGDESKERALLQKEITNLITTSNESSKEFSRFTDAITKDSKEQGDFGELILEQILLDSGLIEGKNYIIQGKGLKLKNENLNPEKPDVILKIPPDKHIIIDSKVSLTSFIDYNQEKDEELKKIHLKNFLISIKKHITGLNRKEYQDQHKLKSLEYVIMFMPRRNAYDLAINNDSSLQVIAEKKDIMIAHEGNIVALLKLVYRVWRLESVNEDALEIIKKADALDGRLKRFYDDHFLKIGRHIELAMKSFDLGDKDIKSGRKPILNQSGELKKIGLSNENLLPKNND